MGKRTSHHDTTKPEALATPITPVGSAALTAGSGLGDAYVKLWHAYQTLAIAYHDKTRRFEADIIELRLLLRAGSPRG